MTTVMDAGDDAAHAPRIEATEIDAPRVIQLTKDVRRDQEAGDDEEDVDPHVAAGKKWNTRVIEHDGKDRDGAESLDVGALPAIVSHCR
jgi:hypothetical protein